MQHLILAASSDHSQAIADSIYRRIAIKNPKTAFITTPIEAEAQIGMKTWEGEDRTALINSGFMTFDYTITGKNKEQIFADLSDCEVIHVTGGNELYFRAKCDESGFEEFIKEHVSKGKPYVGSSCGAIMATQDISPTSMLNDKSLLKEPINTKGFGFVNFSILPHWGLKDFRKEYLVDSFGIHYQESRPLIALNNYQYIEVVGDAWQIVDVRSES